jgi:exopolysaccharide biosynthesis polyprenyl glycosylphosphotransferase
MSEGESRKGRSRRWRRASVYVADAAAGCAAFAAAFVLRAHHSQMPILGALPTREGESFVVTPEYFWLGMITIPLVPLFARVFRAHEGRVPWTRAVVRCLGVALAFGWTGGFLAFVLKLDSVSRLWAGYYFVLAGVLLVAVEVVASRVMNRSRRILLVGDASRAGRIAERIEDTGRRTRVVAVLGGGVSSSLERAERLIDEEDVDDVLVVPGEPGLGDRSQISIARLAARGVRVRVVPRFVDVVLRDERLARAVGPDVFFFDASARGEAESIAARAFDVVGATALAVVTAPIAALIAIGVRLSSPGPVLFRQERIGRHGQPFQILKFRSMVQGAEQQLDADRELYQTYVDSGYKLSDADDPRITRLGRLIRPTGLDELPQLWNVLRGEMSLVGPRPLVPPEIEKVREYVEVLLSVKPGITGLWQVSGQLGGYRQRAELDTSYVLDRSLRRDLGILLRTLPALHRRRRSGKSDASLPTSRRPSAPS